MNKTAIKNFAIWARRKIVADVTYKAGQLGITECGIDSPLPQSTKDVHFFDIGLKEPYPVSGIEIRQRERLVDTINENAKQSDYVRAYKAIIEEVAYSWFNRIIAIRFMEVNEYLPSGVRVLSSAHPNKIEPDFVTMPLDTDLDLSEYEINKIAQNKNENKLDEVFKFLFIRQCNKLNEILPNIFEKTNDCTELLLNVSFTDKGGIISRLISEISEDDFKEAVEIIGWMYQYYNEERKNEVINVYKGTIKKEDIPAATQLFTTDWVVRYMVDNSLGRYWIERNPQSKLKKALEFYVTPKSGEINYVEDKISPRDLTFFDPCMGSGHILVYAFDVLMKIYRECGYTDAEAAKAIVENNLYGLDIDERASQLAYFAVMMRARKYDKNFFARRHVPNILAITETSNLGQFSCCGVSINNDMDAIGEYLIEIYKDAKEIGSLLSIEKKDYRAFKNNLLKCNMPDQLTFDGEYWHNVMMPIMAKLSEQALIMSNKYKVVCTNPPYMNKIEGNLKKFIVENYKPYSGDLFSVFMYRNFDYCERNGYSAFMTPFVWMFIRTYEQLREYIITYKSITTLVQMEYSAFEEATVPICAFVLNNKADSGKGIYIKLTEFKGGMEIQRHKVLEAIISNDCDYFYETSKHNFCKIPSVLIAYWLSDVVYRSFEIQKIDKYIQPRIGLVTGDSDRFLRLWFEISYDKIHFNCNSNV